MPELHVDRAEAAHKLANRGMRANLAMARDLVDLWMYPLAHAVAAHNSLVSKRHATTTNRRVFLLATSRRFRLSCHGLPQVAVLVTPPPNSSSLCAVAATYLGPAQKCGTRAINYMQDNFHVATSSCLPTMHQQNNNFLCTTRSPTQPTSTVSSSTPMMLFDPVDVDDIDPSVTDPCCLRNLLKGCMARKQESAGGDAPHAHVAAHRTPSSKGAHRCSTDYHCFCTTKSVG